MKYIHKLCALYIKWNHHSKHKYQITNEMFVHMTTVQIFYF